MYNEKAIKFSTLTNFRKTVTTQKILFIKDLKNSQLNEKQKSNLHGYLQSLFTDDKKYFDFTSNIIIGKKPHGPRFDSDNNIVPYSIVGRPITRSFRRYQTRLANSSSMSRGSFSDKTLNVSRVNKQRYNKFELTRNFDVLNEKQIADLYKDIQSKIENIKNTPKKKKTKSEKKNLISIPNPITKSLKKQEKFFYRSKNIFKNIQKNKEYISKKLKRNISKLVMSNEDYQKKQQKNIIIENGISNIHKYGDRYWYLSLRNANNITSNKSNVNDNKSEKRYINLSNCENTPMWVPMRLNTVNTVSIKPKSEHKKIFAKTDNHFFKKRMIDQVSKNSKFFKSSKKLISVKLVKCLKNTNMEPNLFNTMNDLEVKGKSLLEVEKNRELSSKCKSKKYYKKDVLDAMLYLKRLNVNSEILNEKDLKKQTYSIFKDQLYASDSHNKDFCKRYLYHKDENGNYCI